MEPRLRTRRLVSSDARGIPTVTVVITCYNYARYLKDSVGSALNQQGVNVNVIVVDDASSDDSIAVAESLQVDDARVTVLANSTNQGPVEAFNRGLAAASGDYIVRLDADDLLTPESLRRAVAVMQQHPSVGLVYGHPLHFEADPPEPRSEATQWLLWSGRAWLEARCRAGTNVITSPEVVMRRAILDAVGGMRPLRHTHDMELWLRIATHADIAYVAGSDQAWHREHSASLSVRAEDPILILGEIREAFNTLFDAVTLPEGARLRRDAMRAVARQAISIARRDVDRGVITERARLLIALAGDVDPGIRYSPAGRCFAAAWRRAKIWPRPAAFAAGMPARLMRRLNDMVRQTRWHRTGVYEPIKWVSREGSAVSRPGGAL